MLVQTTHHQVTQSSVDAITTPWGGGKRDGVCILGRNPPPHTVGTRMGQDGEEGGREMSRLVHRGGGGRKTPPPLPLA